MVVVVVVVILVVVVVVVAIDVVFVVVVVNVEIRCLSGLRLSTREGCGPRRPPWSCQGCIPSAWGAARTD